MKFLIHIFFLISILFLLTCSNKDNPQVKEYSVFDSTYSSECKHKLDSTIMNVWYPRTVDSVHGGFYSDFSFDWKKQKPNNKMLVAQARHIWTTSMYDYVFKTNKYKKYADIGVELLKTTMWDSVYGGMFMIKDSAGAILDYYYTGEKRAYSMAFAIYALSAYYNAYGNDSIKELAMGVFNWLDKYSHDSQYGGYYDMMTRKGEWLFMADFESKTDEGFKKSFKDYNSSIHLLEAFSSLYDITKDARVKERLEEMFYLVRDSFIDSSYHLQLYADREWKFVKIGDSIKLKDRKMFDLDHVTFGHDIETAYLLLEASKSLNIENDTVTLRLSKYLVDNALYAWDTIHGGLYYNGYYKTGTDSLILKDKLKSWWVQAETLHSLLLMHILFPEDKKYGTYFEKQWQYINTFLIDKENGGWYMSGLDTNPEFQELPKANDWKINYHNARALISSYLMLQGRSDLVNHFQKNL